MREEPSVPLDGPDDDARDPALESPLHRLAGRREVWGDDPEEVAASQVVEEFAADEEVQRRWHDHVALAPFRVVASFIRKSGKRIGVTIAGFVLLIVAVIIIPVPGPWSILLTVAALSILATEYIWAQRMLRFAREKADQAKNVVLRRNNGAEGDDAGDQAAAS